ncbi:MAG: DUF87 domain-containing protein [Gemmatimonadota bacterium]
MRRLALPSLALASSFFGRLFRGKGTFPFETGPIGFARAVLSGGGRMDVERGKFYLGGLIDPASGARSGPPVLHPARDLTTHGVITAMTGSGKTGLGIVLLEEAILSGIPVLVLDPKGDMGNLLLAFPELRTEGFEPWVDPAEARREGIEIGELARGALRHSRRPDQGRGVLSHAGLRSEGAPLSGEDDRDLQEPPS